MKKNNLMIISLLIASFIKLDAAWFGHVQCTAEEVTKRLKTLDLSRRLDDSTRQEKIKKLYNPTNDQINGTECDIDTEGNLFKPAKKDDQDLNKKLNGFEIDQDLNKKLIGEYILLQDELQKKSYFLFKFLPHFLPKTVQDRLKKINKEPLAIDIDSNLSYTFVKSCRDNKAFDQIFYTTRFNVSTQTETSEQNMIYRRKHLYSDIAKENEHLKENLLPQLENEIDNVKLWVILATWWYGNNK